MADKERKHEGKTKEGGKQGREKRGRGGELAHAQAIPAVLPAAADSRNTHIIEGTSTSTCLSAQGF